MMIVEIEDKPVTDLVLLKTVHIHSQDPDVEDKDGHASPRREIS